MTFVEYYICRAETYEELQDRVNVLCRGGWQPHGSLVVANIGASVEWFLQPLVRHRVTE
jgi:hypothetical protein